MIVLGAFLVVRSPLHNVAGQPAADSGAPKAEAVPILAAGFVEKDGKLTRSVGVKVVVQKTAAGKYTVTFDKGLDSIPIVVATADGRGGGILSVDSVTKNNFTIVGSRVTLSKETGWLEDTGFHFIVIRALERTP